MHFVDLILNYGVDSHLPIVLFGNEFNFNQTLTLLRDLFFDDPRFKINHVFNHEIEDFINRRSYKNISFVRKNVYILYDVNRKHMNMLENIDLTGVFIIYMNRYVKFDLKVYFVNLFGLTEYEMYSGLKYYCDKKFDVASKDLEFMISEAYHHQRDFKDVIWKLKNGYVHDVKSLRSENGKYDKKKFFISLNENRSEIFKLLFLMKRSINSGNFSFICRFLNDYFEIDNQKLKNNFIKIYCQFILLNGANNTFEYLELYDRIADLIS